MRMQVRRSDAVRFLAPGINTNNRNFVIPSQTVGESDSRLQIKIQENTRPFRLTMLSRTPSSINHECAGVTPSTLRKETVSMADSFYHKIDNRDSINSQSHLSLVQPSLWMVQYPPQQLLQSRCVFSMQERQFVSHSQQLRVIRH